MCEPTTIMMAASTGMSVLSQVQAGQTAKAQANMQADQQDYAASVEQSNALKTADLIRRAGRRQVGAANAGYAGAGVKVGEGSSLEAERYIDQNVQHDAFQALLDGDRRARGLQTDAKLMRINGQQQEAAGYMNAFGTALGGAAQGMKASGWRTAGPGFSGTQKSAPIVDASTRSGSTISGLPSISNFA